MREQLRLKPYALYITRKRGSLSREHCASRLMITTEIHVTSFMHIKEHQKIRVITRSLQPPLTLEKIELKGNDIPWLLLSHVQRFEPLSSEPVAAWGSVLSEGYIL